MLKALRLRTPLVSLSERTVLNIVLFCNFAIAKSCAFFTRFDIFNRFLNWVHGRGVMTRFVR
jgi:hypothetical protein